MSGPVATRALLESFLLATERRDAAEAARLADVTVFTLARWRLRPPGRLRRATRLRILRFLAGEELRRPPAGAAGA